MEITHLTSAHWLKDDFFWSFRDGRGTHLIELLQRPVTDFQGELTQNESHPDPLLIRNPANMPRIRAVPRAERAPRGQPAPHFLTSRSYWISRCAITVTSSVVLFRHLVPSVTMSLHDQRECAGECTDSRRTLKPAPGHLGGGGRDGRGLVLSFLSLISCYLYFYFYYYHFQTFRIYARTFLFYFYA